MSEIVLTKNVATPAPPSSGFLSTYLDANGQAKQQTPAGKIYNFGRPISAEDVEELTNGIKYSPSVTVPIIPANTRYVASFNVGVLRNPSKALVGIVAGALSPIGHPLEFSGDLQILNPATPDPNVIAGLDLSKLIYATTDYTKSRRFAAMPASSTTTEAYGNTPLPVKTFNVALGVYGMSYSSMNVGVLFGFYSYSGVVRSVFNNYFNTRKVELESVWLELSGADSLVKLAFYNRDSSATSAGSMQCLVYE